MSEQHSTPRLNAARRRARKRVLARRDGARCFYCLRPFTDLRQATMDHIVPLSLLRTWSAAHLVLACRPCNHAKADRLSLLLALLLCASTAAVNTCGQSVNTPAALFTARPEDVNGGALAGPVVNAAVNMVNAGSATEVTGGMAGGVTGLAVWRLLARLAHARQSADSVPLYSTDAAVTVGRLCADRARHRSGGGQRVCGVSRPTARCARRAGSVTSMAGKGAA